LARDGFRPESHHRCRAAAWLLALSRALGLNYRRSTRGKLDYDRSRLTRDATIAFVNTAVAKINEGYAAAHQPAARQRRRWRHRLPTRR
jgi:hypothetical protein